MASNNMSPVEAVSFDRVSLTNAETLINALPCGCMPYVDIFTYNRWKAQGFQVQKGQHAVKVPVVKETGDKKKVFRKVSVFCRCQVAPIQEDTP